MPFVLENSVKFMYNRITFFALVIILKGGNVYHEKVVTFY